MKSRGAILRAYREFGARSFAFDSDEELDKIVEETGEAVDLTLFLRVACSNTHSLIPLEGWRIGMGISARKAAADIDAVHHDARLDDQLADLLQCLAERGRANRLRAHMAISRAGKRKPE